MRAGAAARLGPALTLALMLAVGAGLAAAGAPASSPRPKPRPAAAPAVPSAPKLTGRSFRLAPSHSLRPAARPGALRLAAPAAPAAPGKPVTPPAPPPPSAKPKPFAWLLGNRAVPQAEREGKGWICGDRAIEGVRIAEITSPVPGCGIAAPVRVTAVSGIALDSPAVLNCATARTLNSWVRSGLKPAVGHSGGGVVKLTVAASYACRPRDNVKGKKISEHGKGNAIDISGFTLANGTTLTVLDDFRRTRWMRNAYAAACGIFGTTLGPNSDAYHRNHMHFDTAHYRGGPYCR